MTAPGASALAGHPPSLAGLAPGERRPGLPALDREARVLDQRADLVRFVEALGQPERAAAAARPRQRDVGRADARRRIEAGRDRQLPVVAAEEVAAVPPQ